MTVMTGVGAVLCAAHRDKGTGRLHGHTWEITAWVAARRDAIGHQERLTQVVAALDHRELPEELAWGEAIAERIGADMTLGGAVVLQVDVSRPAERIYARWIA